MGAEYKMKRVGKIVLMLMYLGTVFQVSANSFLFYNFTTDDGLSHKSVNCFLQDSKGYVWIGTTYGLNRYDGYHFKTFLAEPGDSLSLGSNIIYEIQEGRDGILWLSTDGGFYSFNPSVEAFTKHYIMGINPFNKHNICVDDKGYVWVLVDGNYLTVVNTINSASKKRFRINAFPYNSNQTIYSTPLYLGGCVWLSCENGVVGYNISTGKIRFIDLRHHGLTSLHVNFMKHCNDSVSLMLIDSRNGILKVNTQTETFEQIAPSRFASVGLGLFAITDAEIDKNGGILVSGIPGLFYVSPQNRITRVSQATGASHDFDRVMSVCMYKDPNENMWIGTLNNGFFVRKHQTDIFEHISANQGSHIDVPLGGLVSTNTGVYSHNINAAFELTHRSIDKSASFSCMNESPVLAVSCDSHQQLYIFEKDRVLQYNNVTHKIRILQAIPRSLHYGIVDSRGVIWACYWGWGIEGFDPVLGKRYKIDIDTVNRNRNVVYRMCEDLDGSLWLGTFGTGLVHVINPRSDKPIITVYAHDNNSNSVSHNIILSIHDDHRGSIWMGTNGGGLCQFAKKTKSFSAFTIREGLKSNVVEAVNSDIDGNIWFASTVMSKYDIRTRQISNFDATDGVTSLYFLGGSCRDSSGRLYFGDDRGALTFLPERIRQGKSPLVPTLTGVRLFGQTVNPREVFGIDTPFPFAIDYTQELILPHYLNSFSIEFACLRVLENRKIEYSYILEGVDKQWNLASINHEANYAGLQPGEYIFKVRSSNGAGVWSISRKIKLTILPPWWKSLPFRVVLTVFVILVLFFLLYFKIKSLNKKNEILENEVKARTAELQLKTDELNEQTVWLKQSNCELQEKQLVIEMKKAQLEEALHAKDKLIGIIAHDFKNPLSALQGISEVLFYKYEQLDATKIRHFVSGILDATQNLQKQMISVLEWAQSQVQEITYKPVEINIETIINDSIELIRQSLQQKGISIATQFDYETTVFIDPRMISTVLRNLLTNAIKFTPRNGIITVIVQEYDNGIEVNVIDNGIGMSKEFVSQLFTSENQQSTLGTEKEKGAGLGLFICKSFIEQNNGFIKATSTEGEGSVLSILLPKGTQIAVRNELVSAAIAKINTNVSELHQTYDQSITVLIVDDDPNIISLLKATFENYYSVLTAFDGDSGLQIARNVIPTLIISDIKMPNKNGIELCEQLKNDELTNHIPIIILTGEKNSILVHTAYTKKIDDFVVKPFDKQLLLYKVQSLIDKNKQLIMQKQLIADMRGFAMPESYEDTAIRRVLEYINTSFGHVDIDVNTVAEAVGLSRAQLWRKFKSSTGYNLSDYIQKLRLEKAKEMLKTGKFRVGEVAYEVGFSNPNYFTRWFSQLVGESPSEYSEHFKKQ